MSISIAAIMITEKMSNYPKWKLSTSFKKLRIGERTQYNVKAVYTHAYV